MEEGVPTAKAILFLLGSENEMDSQKVYGSSSHRVIASKQIELSAKVGLQLKN